MPANRTDAILSIMITFAIAFIVGHAVLSSLPQ